VRWHDLGERSLNFKINWSKPGSNTSSEALMLRNVQQQLSYWTSRRADAGRTSRKRASFLPTLAKETKANDDRGQILPRVRG